MNNFVNRRIFSHVAILFMMNYRKVWIFNDVISVLIFQSASTAIVNYDKQHYILPSNIFVIFLLFVSLPFFFFLYLILFFSFFLVIFISFSIHHLLLFLLFSSFFSSLSPLSPFLLLFLLFFHFHPDILPTVANFQERMQLRRSLIELEDQNVQNGIEVRTQNMKWKSYKLYIL